MRRFSESRVETIYPGVRLVLTDPMPAEAVEIAHKQVLLAAEDLDGHGVATLVLELAEAWGVPALWEQVCRPLLARLPGRTAAELVVEHALSEGVRVALDVYRREPGRPLPSGGVLLAGVERRRTASVCRRWQPRCASRVAAASISARRCPGRR